MKRQQKSYPNNRNKRLKKSDSQEDLGVVSNSSSKIEDIDSTHYGKYYKKIIGKKDWDAFKKHAQIPLPFTFRVNISDKSVSELLKDSFVKFTDSLRQEFKAADIAPPKNISWYPNAMAWKFDCSVGKVEKSLGRYFGEVTKLSSNGYLYRQEEVSMIPACLLGIESHHHILDMCASPGSKTSQILNLMALSGNITGLLVANDSNYKRCFILSDIKNPALVVTNHEGQCFPTAITDNAESHPLRFDRVLCDVPCSGDGTTRKLPRNFIGQWNGTDAISLHSLQLSIAVRGLTVLKPQGRMVYSTCSLNPVENEAVVAQILNMFPKKIRLCDVSKEAEGLVYRPGLTKWKVFSNGSSMKSYEEKEGLKESMFPPKNSNDIGLEKCLRFYPHLQDTGGFFVAVFEKISDFDQDETLDALATPHTVLSKRQIKKRYAESDMLVPSDESVIKDVFTVIGSQKRLKTCLFNKKSEELKVSKVYVCSDGLSKLLNILGDKNTHLVGKQLRVVSIGEKLCDSAENKFKLSSDISLQGIYKNAKLKFSTEEMLYTLEKRKGTAYNSDYGFIVVRSKEFLPLFIVCRQTRLSLGLCGTEGELNLLKFIISNSPKVSTPLT